MAVVPICNYMSSTASKIISVFIKSGLNHIFHCWQSCSIKLNHLSLLTQASFFIADTYTQKKLTQQAKNHLSVQMPQLTCKHWSIILQCKICGIYFHYQFYKWTHAYILLYTIQHIKTMPYINAVYMLSCIHQVKQLIVSIYYQNTAPWSLLWI